MLRRLRFPWRTVALAAAALAAATPVAFDLLVMDREAVLGGELWRPLTAHLVHATRYHLTWDVAALLLLGFQFERVLGRRFFPVTLGSGLTVGLGVLLLQPETSFYCGLSGVLNGLWVAGALVFARREERRGRRALAWLFRAAVLAGLAKIALETALGSPLFTDAARLGADPVPLAHALGALAGALLSCEEKPWAREDQARTVAPSGTSWPSRRWTTR